jgi:hypothetical protein
MEVEKYPEVTNDNDCIIEMLKEKEADRGDTVDITKIPPGLRKVNVIVQAEKSNFESTYEDDVWLDFELIS